MLLLNMLLASSASAYALTFTLEVDISSIWRKDDVTYYMFDKLQPYGAMEIRLLLLFRETITASHVCRYSTIH